jgi:hypothetical protein
MRATEKDVDYPPRPDSTAKAHLTPSHDGMDIEMLITVMDGSEVHKEVGQPPHLLILR